jgi:hypothetical protein
MASVPGVIEVEHFLVFQNLHHASASLCVAQINAKQYEIQSEAVRIEAYLGLV